MQSSFYGYILTAADVNSSGVVVPGNLPHIDKAYILALIRDHRPASVIQDTLVTQDQSNQGFDQWKMTISLSYKVLSGIMSVLKEDKTMYQTCDMDGLIRVSPHAVFYIFHAFIGLITTGTQSAPYLPAKALLCVTVYVSGLVALEKKQTQSRIAKTIGHVTHDALNRMADMLPMLCTQMAVGMTSLITGIYETGYIILDDTVVPKPFSRLVAGTYVDYDYTQKRHVRCHRIVVVIWTNGAIYIPVAFAFWHHRDFVSRYRTKNQIARILIYYVVRHHIPFSYLTFDNWYASKESLRFFGKLGIKFVTRLRNNTWIVHENERQKTQKLTKYECHYYSKLNAYVRRFQVKYPRFGTGYLAIVKNDKHVSRTTNMRNLARPSISSPMICSLLTQNSYYAIAVDGMLRFFSEPVSNTLA